MVRVKYINDWMLRVNSTWHRVYAVCFSNCASYYVVCGKQDYYLSDAFFSGLRDRLKSSGRR